MKVENVGKLSPEGRFLYWIRERHRIHVRRHKEKMPKPWTDDEVLQSYFFTNPFRENDKTTRWFRVQVRKPLQDKRVVLMATIIFRWFNLINTGRALKQYTPRPRGRRGDSYGLLTNWNEKAAVKLLRGLNEEGPVFTGAFMIKAGNGEPGCKIPQICSCIQNVWINRQQLLDEWDRGELSTLQDFHKRLCKFYGMGKFMAYEAVTDLRHTMFLRGAPDINTWANPGPGCRRGLFRLEGGTPGMDPHIKVDDPVGKMQELLKLANRKLPADIPRLEMREVEHSLCEFDKYERARTGTGRMKRVYNGCD